MFLQFIKKGSFNADNLPADGYSHTMAILLAFVPNPHLSDIKRVGIGNVIWRHRSPLGDIASIHSVIDQIRSILATKCKKDSARRRAYMSMSLLDISTADDEDTHKHKACELARKSDTDFAAWREKLIHEGATGIQEWDSMVNDYADTGKRRPKNPDTIGPPISYMMECGVFQPLPSMMNPLGLCHFYPADPSSLSTLPPLKPPTTKGHLKSLLVLAKARHPPYVIVVFQGGPITPLGLLQELHMWHMLAHIPIFLPDEAKDGHRPWVSCCPFCTYTIQNDPVYLNHIIGMHYHVSLACGACLGHLSHVGSAAEETPFWVLQAGHSSQRIVTGKCTQWAFA